LLTVAAEGGRKAECVRDVEGEGWYVKFNGLGVAPDTCAFFASDVLNDLVEDL
jgi:hypothetical protein